jgi:hypothetical protein
MQPLHSADPALLCRLSRSASSQADFELGAPGTPPFPRRCLESSPGRLIERGWERLNLQVALRFTPRLGSGPLFLLFELGLAPASPALKSGEGARAIRFPLLFACHSKTAAIQWQSVSAVGVGRDTVASELTEIHALWSD